MRMFFVPEEVPKLTFETSPGTQFTITHGSTGDDVPVGHTMEKGSRLQLSQGTVELTFGSGVKSIVMTPADLTLHDDDTLFMNQGTAWFHVPKGAEGFRVKTRDLDIVDLGTEFGVFAIPDNHDEVHVLKGKVEVITKRLRKKSATLVAGEARRIDPIGRLTTIPIKPSAFLTILPKSLPYIRWTFNKEDGFQATGSHPALADITSTAKASPSLVPGKRGRALSLNGDGQQLKTDWAGFAGNRPRSVAFWIKLPLDGQYDDFAGIVGWGDNALKAGKWELIVSQTEIGLGHLVLYWGRESVTTKHVIKPETWCHVVVTDTGKTDSQGSPQVKFYFNGKSESLSSPAKQQNPASIVTTTLDAEPLSIGTTIREQALKDKRRFLKAKIDELYIFDGALSDEQVRRFSTEQLSLVEKK